MSFVGDGITLDPELQTQDLRYEKLPLPRADGRVFAGWYSSAADATALNTDGRINGADLVACTQRQRTLYAGWTTPEANAAQATELPILMYHQFTQKPEGEDNWLRGNYAYIGDFDAQMAYIQEERFYLPTWDEVDAFIDGALFLPKRSVVITDDDADSTWLSMAAPIVDARNLLTTSFVITSARSEPPPTGSSSNARTRTTCTARAPTARGAWSTRTPTPSPRTSRPPRRSSAPRRSWPTRSGTTTTRRKRGSAGRASPWAGDRTGVRPDRNG